MPTTTATYLPSPASLDEAALDAFLQGNKQAGLLALVAEADKQCIPALQALCNRTGTPLIGAMFPALIDDGKLENRGLVLFRFTHMPPYWLVGGLDKSAETPGMGLSELVDELASQTQPQGDATLFLMFDGMLPNVGSMLDSLYLQLADQFSYAGANAGSETFQPMPCLFDNHRFVQHALLAILLEGQADSALEHGYRPPQHIVAATSTQGNRITSIDWRPAFEVYKELMQKQHGVEITQENFYQHAVHHPFGILRMDGGVLVRIPVALLDDGALLCVGEVPENAVLTLLHAAAAGSEDTIATLVDELGHPDTDAFLAFYCAGRRMHLGAGAEAELAGLQSRLAPSHLFGALSLGEIGSSVRHGYPLFHNAAIVCAPWSKA